MPPSENLRQLIADQITNSCDFPDAGRDRLVDQLRGRYGPGLLAVLIYGSYLRGKRDTLLDFYVLLDSYAQTLAGRARQIAAAQCVPGLGGQSAAGNPRQVCTAYCGAVRELYAARFPFLFLGTLRTTLRFALCARRSGAGARDLCARHGQHDFRPTSDADAARQLRRPRILVHRPGVHLRL